MPDGDPRMAYTLDFGRAEDFEQILIMLFEMHREVGMFPLAPAKVSAMVDMIIRGQESGNTFLITARTSSGVIAASIGLMKGAFWYTDEVFLQDRWFFVRKPHRHSRLAEQMIEGAKTVARQFEIPLGMGVQGVDETARKNTLLRRHMTPIGELFIYRP